MKLSVKPITKAIGGGDEWKRQLKEKIDKQQGKRHGACGLRRSEPGLMDVTVAVLLQRGL